MPRKAGLLNAPEAIKFGLSAEEEQPDRVQPMALMRCSRGGKTRVLLELNKMLRERNPEVSVVYVSFNNFSSLEAWELRDPVAALCRRIAFSALRERNATHGGFDAFRNTTVMEDDIIRWLGDTACVLLIDELNVLELDEDGGSFGCCVSEETLLDSAWPLLCLLFACDAQRQGFGGFHGLNQ